MAIISAVRSPELYELTKPLEILRENAGILESLGSSGEYGPTPHHSGFADSILAGRIDEAATLATQHYNKNGSVDKVLEELFYPTLGETGRRWRENLISVAEEHAATSALRTVATRFFDSLPSRREHQWPVVVTCVPGDEHELGAEILYRYLSAEGWRVYFIGRSSPEGEIIRELERREYGAILLSVSMIRHLPAFEKLTLKIREMRPEIRVIAGGGALAQAGAVMGELADATAKSPAGANRILSEWERSDA
jgi:methanogenic corrinoid protein MtbC1